jgi:hypothetical protein
VAIINLQEVIPIEELVVNSYLSLTSGLLSDAAPGAEAGSIERRI